MSYNEERPSKFCREVRLIFNVINKTDFIPSNDGFFIVKLNFNQLERAHCYMIGLL